MSMGVRSGPERVTAQPRRTVPACASTDPPVPALPPTKEAAIAATSAAADPIDPWYGLGKWIALASEHPLVVPAGTQLPCTGMDPEFFYEQRHWLMARRTCEGCPIREHCLQVAVARDEDGIWGGMTKKQRQRWAAQQGLLVSELRTPKRSSAS